MMKTLLLLVGLFCYSCSEHSATTPQIEKYGLGWDSVRRTIGLPLIKGNLALRSYAFECLDPYTDCAMFTNEDTNIKPRFERKNVYWDSAGINLERNYFIGPHNEVLQIYYGYKKFSDWTHIGFGYGFILPGKGRVDAFGKKQADSVLLSWKIQYQNHQ